MEIQGLKFQLKEPTLNTKKYLTRLVAGLRKITHLYTGDVDFRILEGYRKKLNELNLAKQQVSKVLEEKKDSKGELTEEKTAEYETALANLVERIGILNSEFSEDLEAQSQQDLLNELEALALLEYSKDEKAIKPILKQILEGEVDKIDFDEDDVAPFLAGIITGFFLKSRN